EQAARVSRQPAECLPGAAVFRDVGKSLQTSGEGAILVEHWGGGNSGPELVTVLPVEPAVIRFAPGARTQPLRPGSPWAIRGEHELLEAPPDHLFWCAVEHLREPAVGVDRPPVRVQQPDS